jgi:peptide/nickel transport system substrate-binding protein
MALALGATPLTASAQTEKPQYGGTLSLGMVYVTLSPLSWDPTD